MITEEELKFLQKDYEKKLASEEKKKNPRSDEIFRLYGMIDFLGAWGMMKRDKVGGN